MPTAETKDLAWKVATAAVTAAMIAIGNWVWSIEGRVTNLDNDMEDAQADIRKLEGISDDVIAMKKDIEYMRVTMDRIETALSKLGDQ
jgi:hypothetical protein